MIDRCRRSLSPDALGDAAFVVVAAVLFPVVAVEGWDRGTLVSAEAEGYRTERSLMDCVAPPSKGGDAIHQ